MKQKSNFETSSTQIPQRIELFQNLSLDLLTAYFKPAITIDNKNIFPIGA